MWKKRKHPTPKGSDLTADLALDLDRVRDVELALDPRALADD